jgi:dethiobiotin synthetase/adenosylmethionine--8-amino-7-oxononanoate aminotransferase
LCDESKTKGQNLGIYNLNFSEESRFVKDGFHVVSELVCNETLYAWKEAVSPHLEAEKENGVVEGSLVLDTLEKSLGKVEVRKEGMDVFCVVETAGGVASPAPSGPCNATCTGMCHFSPVNEC